MKSTSKAVISVSQQAAAVHVSGIPKRLYAWRPDVPDHRDRAYRTPPRAIAALPPVVDQIGLSNPIEDQGQMGSCTGNSSTSMLEIALGLTVPQSRLMAYYNGRVIDGTTKTDAGAQIRSVIKGLVNLGVADENLWKYTQTNLTRAPGKTAVDQGATTAALVLSKKLGYYRVDSLDGLMLALSKGGTVTFGFTVTAAIDNLPASGILRLPRASEPSIGGHAVLAVGYDSVKKFVWVRNSWGAGWGLNGYFKMPFGWFTDPRRLVDDMWTLD